MPTYKTSGSQCAVDVEEADGVLQRTLLKRGIGGSRHGGQLEEEEDMKNKDQRYEKETSSWALKKRGNLCEFGWKLCRTTRCSIAGWIAQQRGAGR